MLNEPELASEREFALQYRAAWMRLMGFPEEEIQQACQEKGPVDILEELENLQAAQRLPQVTPPSEQLRAWAAMY